MRPPRILIIAGSDCSGGAGIQADIKTVTALGGYAMSAITAITVQNTLGVSDVHAVPAAIVSGQIDACLSDIGADCIKLGMLLNADIIRAVSDAIRDAAVPVILDPVMIATSGARLLNEDALDALGELMRSAALITPNIPEASFLTGMPVTTPEEMLIAARQLQFMTGGTAVLLKGGHLEGDEVKDLLLQEGEAFWFSSAKIETPHTHGTGCTLASAIATIGAKGNPLHTAVRDARDYVQEAIRSAPGFGAGHGPLNHLHPLG
jgi:hydroxymethylpyrimidine/phosphomethylpyrimidine kinase